jgi:hypothetical protein
MGDLHISAQDYDLRTGMLVRALSAVTIPTGRETIEYVLVNPR